MKNKDKLAWSAKSARQNAGWELKVGDSVIDIYKNPGIVVKIESGNDVEDHGFIYVWQSARTEYSADNCEHYVHFGWESFLRVTNDKR